MNKLKELHPKLYNWLFGKQIIPCFYCSEESKYLKHENLGEYIALPTCETHFANDRKQVYIESMCRVIDEALERKPNLYKGPKNRVLAKT